MSATTQTSPALTRLKDSLHIKEEVILSDRLAAMLRPYCEGRAPRLLEIGCSNGKYASRRRSQMGGTADVYGVDVGTMRLEEAKQRGIRAYSCDCEREKLPFESDFFDMVISNQVMEHLKEIHLVTDEIHRVLKPNGLLLVSVPNLAALHNRLLLLFGRQPTTLRAMTEHVRGFAPDEFVRFLTLNGLFDLVSYKASGFYPIPPPLSGLLSKVFPRLSVFQIALLRKARSDGPKWVSEFKRLHIEGYGEDFWYE